MADRPSQAHPLAVQCPAKSKRSGARCKRRVIGGGPCSMHGGRAPQVARARRDRVTLAEALAADPRRPATAVLGDTVHAFDVLARRAVADLDAKGLDADALAQITDALDRAGRWAKTALEAQVDDRQARASEAQVAAVVAGVQRAIAAEVHDAATRERLANRIRQELSGGTPVTPAIEGDRVR